MVGLFSLFNAEDPFLLYMSNIRSLLLLLLFTCYILFLFKIPHLTFFLGTSYYSVRPHAYPKLLEPQLINYKKKLSSFFLDNEPPQFLNCPTAPIVVQRGKDGGFLPVDFIEPQAVDNSGMVARIEVRPEDFTLPVTLFEDKELEYLAYDFDGNVAICQVNITVEGNNFFLIKLFSGTLWYL